VTTGRGSSRWAWVGRPRSFQRISPSVIGCSVTRFASSHALPSPPRPVGLAAPQGNVGKFPCANVVDTALHSKETIDKWIEEEKEKAGGWETMPIGEQPLPPFCCLPFALRVCFWLLSHHAVSCRRKRPLYIADKRSLCAANKRPICTANKRPLCTANKRSLCTADKRSLCAADKRPICTPAHPSRQRPPSSHRCRPVPPKLRRGCIGHSVAVCMSAESG